MARAETFLEVAHLSYAVQDERGRKTTLIHDAAFSLPAGSRCLLLGANGAGKSSLLRVLAGQVMASPRNAVLVRGAEPFAASVVPVKNASPRTGSAEATATGLPLSRVVRGPSSCLCESAAHWARRDVAFSASSAPMAGGGLPGLGAAADPRKGLLEAMLRVPGASRDRALRVLRALGVGEPGEPSPDALSLAPPVSDGTRARLSLALSLTAPTDLVLLDEATADLDLLSRAELLDFLRQDAEERECVVIYATHIFDGLEDWPTHVLYASHGVIGEAVVVQSDPNLSHGRILSWALPRLARDDAVEKDAGDTLTHVGAWNNGYASGRLVSTRKE